MRQKSSRMGHPGLLVLRGRRDRPGHKVFKVHPVRRDSQGRMEHRGLRDQLEHKAQRDRKAYKAPPDLKGRKAIRGCRVSRAYKASKAFRGHRDRPARTISRRLG